MIALRVGSNKLPSILRQLPSGDHLRLEHGTVCVLIISPINFSLLLASEDR